MSRRISPPEAVAGLVLASGLSRRFGMTNKLLAMVDGTPVVRRTVEAYSGAGLAPVLVVVGHEEGRIREALTGLPIDFVENPDYEQGQSRSLVRGVRELPDSSRAAVIGVADQPLLTPRVVGRLVAAYEKHHAGLVAPRYGGRRGNPVLFDRSLFADLLQVEGDQGGRSVIERHADAVLWLDVEEERIGMDVDTPEDYRTLVH